MKLFTESSVEKTEGWLVDRLESTAVRKHEGENRPAYFGEEDRDHAFETFVPVDFESFELLLELVVGLRRHLIENGFDVAEDFEVHIEFVLIDGLVGILHPIGEIRFLRQVDAWLTLRVVRIVALGILKTCQRGMVARR